MASKLFFKRSELPGDDAKATAAGGGDEKAAPPKAAAGAMVVKDVEAGEVTLSRALTRIDGMSLICSSIIGSGIFAAPGVLLSNVGGDATLAMIVWVFGSVLAACQGFMFAELATLHPGAGGEYTYLRLAFGDATSFVWSFSQYWVLQPAGRAILGFTIARYFYGGLHPNDSAANNDNNWVLKLIGVIAMILVTVVNCLKVKFAARVFKGFVSLKFLLVILMAIFMIIQLSRSTAVIAENFGSPFATASFRNLGPALIGASRAASTPPPARDDGRGGRPS